MIVGIPTETYPGERRVALVPSSLASLRRAGLEALIQSGCGVSAGFPDAAYTDKGAKIAGSRKELFATADIVVQVRALGANPDHGKADLTLLRSGQLVVGHFEPLTALDCAEEIAGRGVTQFAMELIPRIARAQSMDVLSSMAGIAGYKAVLIAADRLPKIFPMMMTAAGTIAAAKVLVIGAGVAGLQAIATARRLGAVVHAYDVRPAVKEQVISLGGKFVEMDIGAADVEGKGGYAKELGANQIQQQRILLDKVVSESDVVLCTAAVPGKKAPLIITADMVSHMSPGSVVVDLAAERGGNCECTRPGEDVDVNGVTVLGPLNLASQIPYHASQMYSKNIQTFLLHLIKDGALKLDLNDEITKSTLVCRDGVIVHEQIRSLRGDAPLVATTSTEGHSKDAAVAIADASAAPLSNRVNHTAAASDKHTGTASDKHTGTASDKHTGTASDKHTGTASDKAAATE